MHSLHVTDRREGILTLMPSELKSYGWVPLPSSFTHFLKKLQMLPIMLKNKHSAHLNNKGEWNLNEKSLKTQKRNKKEDTNTNYQTCIAPS